MSTFPFHALRRPASEQRRPAAEGFAEGPDGTRLFYEVFEPPAGALPAPAFLFNDGIGCDGFIWKHLKAQFQDRHRIVHWHYRGHGKSGMPHDKERTGFADLCGDLSAVLRATGTPRAIFFGHSMGVQFALEYQRRHPEQVLALVLALGSHGRLLDTFHDTRILRTVIPLLDLASLEWPQLTRFTWRLLCGSELSYQLATHLEVNGPLMERADLSPYFDHLSGLDPQLFLSMLRNAGRHSVYDHLPSIAVPTLIIAGTNDTFTPSWLSEEMHDRIPGSEMLTIPGGTHVALLEQPELIQLRLERFLLRVGMPPREAEEPPRADRTGWTSGAEP